LAGESANGAAFGHWQLAFGLSGIVMHQGIPDGSISLSIRVDEKMMADSNLFKEKGSS
jgi:hypothetical protein